MDLVTPHQLHGLALDMKTGLQDVDARFDWTMDPVLAHLKPRLSAENHPLLTALVAALSDRGAIEGLEAFPQWHDQPLLPLGD